MVLLLEARICIFPGFVLFWRVEGGGGMCCIGCVEIVLRGQTENRHRHVQYGNNGCV